MVPATNKHTRRERLRKAAYLILAFTLFIPLLSVGGGKSLAASASWPLIDGGGVNGINLAVTNHANYPTIAVYNNQVYAAWLESINSVNKIIVKRLIGYNWVNISGNGLNYHDRNANNPTMTVADGKLYVAWDEMNLPTSPSQIKVKSFDGSVWSEVVEGNGLNITASKSATAPALAVFDDGLYAAWHETNDNNVNQIRVKKYEGGKTWTSLDGEGQTGLNRNGANGAAFPAMAAFKGSLYVTWAESNGTSGQIRVKRYDGGTSWTSVDGDDMNTGINMVSYYNGTKPSMAALDDFLVVIWEEAPVRSTDSKIRAKKYDGTDWANAEGSSTNGLNRYDGFQVREPALIAFNDEWYATWQEIKLSTIIYQIRVKKYNGTEWTFVDGGANDGLNKNVGETAVDPAIAAGNNELFVAWQEKSPEAGKYNQIRVAQYVEPAVRGVTVNPNSASVAQGGVRQLLYTVDAVGGAATTATWSSSDSGNKVTVDSMGKVTVAADAELGDYTITATSTFDTSKMGTATITVTDAYSYSIAPISDQTLTSLTLGYPTGTQEKRPVTISNSGTGALTNLSVSLSGANANDFIATDPVSSSLASGASTSFDLYVEDGLPADTYTATVTVTADRLAPVSFVVTQAVNLPNAPANPHDVTALGGDRLATLDWSPVPDATQYRVYMATDPNPSDFAEVATVTSATYGAFNLVNGTTYYFIVKSENPGGLSAASNVATVTPSALPGVPTDVTATAGNGQAVVSFTPPTDNGGSPIAGYEVIVSPGNEVVAGGSSPITVTGLTNGVSYTFTVRAINGAGRSAASAESNAVVPVAPPTDNGGPSPSQPSAPTAPSAPNETGVDILVNGKVEKAGTAKDSKRGDRTVLTVAVDQKKLNDKLAAEGQHAVVTIPIGQSGKYDIVVGELNGRMVKNMEDKQAVLEFKTEAATYTLPARQIQIGSISEQAGRAVALEDIKVRIEIAVPTAETLKAANDAAAKGRLELVGQPWSFTVTAVHGDRIFEVEKFDAYVERTIALPDGIDPNKITTGVVVEPDGSVRHVPTEVRRTGERYEARINSLTNSAYAVVWHPLEFDDMTKHWAKDAVNDMGSRMVVDGTGNGLYRPDREITRAEFAAIVVRGLGLKPENGATPFSDVKPSEWYGSAVHTAYAYGLISGLDDGTFRPNDKVTREQAMLILSKAMALTGLKEKLTPSAADAALRPFADASAVSGWAQSGVADNVQAGLVQGRNGSSLAPKGYLTRAEVAALIQRLLQKSDLI